MALTNEEKKAYAIKYLSGFVEELEYGGRDPRTINDLYDFMLLSASDKVNIIRTDYINKRKIQVQKQLDNQAGNKLKWEAELTKLNEY